MFSKPLQNVDAKFSASNFQAWIQPEIEGGQFGERGAKSKMENERIEGARKFWGFIQENSLVFLLKKPLSLSMFPLIQKETLKKVHLGQDKGCCSC